MDNGRITGGSVSFLKRINRGNYEHEEASTKVDFVANDGMDAGPVLAAAETEARASVMAQLGLASRPLAAVSATVQAPPQSANAAEKPAGRVAHRKSAQIEKLDAAAKVDDDPLAPAPAGDAVAGAATSGPRSVAGGSDQSADDPLAPAAAPMSTSSPVTGTVAAATPASSGDDDPLAPAGASDTTASSTSEADFTAQREVTDADLTTAAAKKNEKLVLLHKEAGTAKIRDLIGKYLPPGKPLRELPQAQRAEFLDKLEALA